ncbi:MAG: hypothetical protein AB1351_02870 [Thermoproteota archaeon]
MIDKTRTSYTVMPITRSILADLCQRIDQELEKSNQDHSLAIYEIVSKKQHVQSHDSRSFLTYTLHDDLSSIFLRLQTPHRRITIKMSPSKDESYVAVEGSDPEWVRSTTQRIGNIIDVHKSHIDKNQSFLPKLKSIVLRVCAGIMMWAMLLRNAG